MIIKYSDTNENRIYWQHRKGEEWKTAELDELIGAYEREKTGKWIDHMYKKYPTGRYECSVCGAWHDMDWYYCPNCGARMVD